MKRRIVIMLVLVLSVTSMTACKSSGVDTVGEHSDTFSKIETSKNGVTDTSVGSDYTINEKGEVETNTDFLNNVESNNSTAFEAQQDSNSISTTNDKEELNDSLGIYGQINTISVVNEINKIASDNKYSKVEIVVNPESDYAEEGQIQEDVINYIVRFDDYDYYYISYYNGEGCSSHHDTTGVLAEEYGEDIDKERELEREYGEAEH